MNTRPNAAESIAKVQQLVGEVMQTRGLGYAEAFARVEREHPELLQGANNGAQTTVFANARRPTVEFVSGPVSFSHP